MNDLVILGLSLGGFFAFAILIIFIIQERAADKRATELRMFQMENTRLIQQMEKESQLRHAQNDRFFRGLSYSVGQIYLKLDEEQNGKT